jgi:phosphohistidine phosphatase
MLTLSLLRHAKSAWDDPTLGDHDRPLAPRGEKAAPAMGRFIATHDLVPELVLCSTAMRTRQTIALALLEMPRKPSDILYEDDVYLATPTALRARLAQVDDTVRHIMIVGHNPGLHALALELTGTGARRAVIDMARKFSTAALAVIDFHDAEQWSGIRPAAGALRLFVTPRDLD